MKSTKFQYLVDTYGEKLIKAFIADGGNLMPAKDVENAENTALLCRQVLNKLKLADPTKGKYLQAIVRWYVAGAFRCEDVQRLNDDLTFFNKIKFKVEQADLLKYDTLKSVYDAMRPFQENESDSKSGKELMREAKAGAKKLYQDKGIIILELQTEEAAKLYGKGTRWCTAGDNNNMFKHYHDQGPLYIIIADDPEGKTRKFQMHYQSSQFMDEDDTTINSSDDSEELKWLCEYEVYRKFADDVYYLNHKEILDVYRDLLARDEIWPDGTVKHKNEAQEQKQAIAE